MEQEVKAGTSLAALAFLQQARSTLIKDLARSRQGNTPDGSADSGARMLQEALQKKQAAVEASRLGLGAEVRRKDWWEHDGALVLCPCALAFLLCLQPSSMCND